MRKMSKKMRVASVVVASAIGFSALSTGVFAYNDNIRNLIYQGVAKAVTMLSPDIQNQLDAHQNQINQQVQQDVNDAKNSAWQALEDFKAQVIQDGKNQQQAQYNQDKAQFDQDVSAAIQNGKNQLVQIEQNKVNENKAETDSTYESALQAIVN